MFLKFSTITQGHFLQFFKFFKNLKKSVETWRKIPYMQRMMPPMSFRHSSGFWALEKVITVNYMCNFLKLPEDYNSDVGESPSYSTLLMKWCSDHFLMLKSFTFRGKFCTLRDFILKLKYLDEFKKSNFET